LLQIQSKTQTNQKRKNIKIKQKIWLFAITVDYLGHKEDLLNMKDRVLVDYPGSNQFKSKIDIIFNVKNAPPASEEKMFQIIVKNVLKYPCLNKKIQKNNWLYKKHLPKIFKSASQRLQSNTLNSIVSKVRASKMESRENKVLFSMKIFLARLSTSSLLLLLAKKQSKYCPMI
jgi:hypothetical protein